jgi:hypothetical protein
MARQPGGHLFDLTCVICFRGFVSHRKTRWCTKECRRVDRASRRENDVIALLANDEQAFLRSA